MSRHDSLMAASAASVLNQHLGSAGAYAPPANSDVQAAVVAALTIRVSERRATALDERGNEIAIRTATVWAMSADVTCEIGGRFTLGSDVWNVIEQPVLASGEYQCECALERRHTSGQRRGGNA